MRRGPASLILMLVLVGCGRYFMPDRNITEHLTEAALTGTWDLTPASLDLLARDGFRREQSQRYQLQFNPDGSCEFASALDDFRGATYTLSACSWVLKHDTASCSNIRQANALLIDLPRGESRYTYCLSVAREDGQLVLWNYYGDPDSWEFMEYVSKPRNATSNYRLKPPAGAGLAADKQGQRSPAAA